MITDSNQLDDCVARAVAGERSALDSLLLHFHDPLRRHIGASIAVGGLAGISHDDLFQETIVAAIRGIRGIEPRGADAFFSWLKVIAANCHRNMIKAANTKKRGAEYRQIGPNQDSDPASAAAVLSQAPATGPTPSLIYRRKEATEVIARAIAALGPEQRQLIDLYYNSRLSVRELAVRLGKSEQAIRTSIHRIHQGLRDTVRLEFGNFSTGL